MAEESRKIFKSERREPQNLKKLSITQPDLVSHWGALLVGGPSLCNTKTQENVSVCTGPERRPEVPTWYLHYLVDVQVKSFVHTLLILSSPVLEVHAIPKTSTTQQ